MVWFRNIIVNTLNKGDKDDDDNDNDDDDDDDNIIIIKIIKFCNSFPLLHRLLMLSRLSPYLPDYCVITC